MPRKLAAASRGFFYDLILSVLLRVNPWPALYPFSFPARFHDINSPIVEPVLDDGCL
jgi:hypothetical protein